MATTSDLEPAGMHPRLMFESYFTEGARPWDGYGKSRAFGVSTGRRVIASRTSA
jgi:hypothetical protein